MTSNTSTNLNNSEMKIKVSLNKDNSLINNDQIKNQNIEKNNIIHSDGRWNPEEHIRFIKGCLLFGNNWKKVEGYVQTRTSTQIRSHAQKFLIKLKKKYKINDTCLNNEKNTNFIIQNDEIKDDSIKEDIDSIIKNFNSINEIDNEMEKVERLLLKIFKINKRNGDIQIIKRIKTPPISVNKKIFKCQKEMKTNQLKDKIYSWLNSNEKEVLENLINLINSNDEKIKSTLESIYQNDEIYHQIVYNEI
jgi:SHAQKYF class myb-like DNA-binding protein